MLAAASRELREQSATRHDLAREARNWTLGFASVALGADAPPCVGIDAANPPERLGNYPREEVLRLARVLNREGGRLCFAPPRGVLLGGFALDAEARPVVVLSLGRWGNRKNRATLHHERSHFELWRAIRNYLRERGEKEVDAALAARAMLSSPLGILADEATAALAELRSHGDRWPFGNLEEIVPTVNYPSLLALEGAIYFARDYRHLRPKIRPAAVRWLQENMRQLAEATRARTRQFRGLLANYYRRQTRHTPVEAFTIYRRALAGSEQIDERTFRELPVWVRQQLAAARLDEPPTSLEDFFGTAVEPDPPWVRDELAKLLLASSSEPGS